MVELTRHQSNPSRSHKMECGAYHSLLAQHCGKDKWILLLRNTYRYTAQRKWDRTMGCALQSHIDKYRDDYVGIETAVQYVPYQLPLASTTVTNLLNTTELCVDPSVAAQRAAIASEDNSMSKN